MKFKRKIYILFFLFTLFTLQASAAVIVDFPEGGGGMDGGLLPDLGSLNGEPSETFLDGEMPDSGINTTLELPTSRNANPGAITAPSTNLFQPTTQTNYFNGLRPTPAIPQPKEVGLFNQIVSGNIFGGDPLNKLLNQLFYIGLIAAVILAIVMIIRGGIEYMTIDAIASKENGKKRVQAALGGLVLAFSAILILNTINPGLTSLKIVFQQISGIKQVDVITALTTNTTPMAVDGWARDENGNYVKKQSDGSVLVSTPSGANYTVYPDGTTRIGLIAPDGTVVPVLNGQDEETVRKYFAENGISINKAAGPANANGVTGGFTNVAGLGEAAMRGVVQLKNASGGSVIITGGTELGHATHGAGRSIVDLRIGDSNLDNYIKNNAVTSYPRGSYTEYKHADGTTYMNEGSHWHVEFK